MYAELVLFNCSVLGFKELVCLIAMIARKKENVRIYRKKIS